MKKTYDIRRRYSPFLKKVLLTMKLTTVILLISMVHVSGNVYTQHSKLSLNMKDTSVKSVLQKIESLTEYRFLYQNEQLNLNEKTNIEIHEGNVLQILEQVLDPEKIDYQITESNLILLKPAVLQRNEKNAPQNNSISGKIIDKNGMPLPGVSVVLKGTTIGTVSDGDGQFYLEDIPIGSVIVFSFVGMKDHEMVFDQSQANVTIIMEEDVIGMDEVVVIGYGQVKKQDATGAVVAVGEKDFNQGSTGTAQDLITGKVAGVNLVTEGGQPGSSVKVRIRGGSSMSASNDPLYVVDGVPIDDRGIDGMSNILSSINPNDIESITVLKDASSTAIYGSRASNGVIIINTKKAIKGQKLAVSYNSKFLLGSVVEKVELLSADEYREIINQRHPEDNDVDTAIRNRVGTANTDWQDEIYQTSIGHDHNISIAGSYKNIPIRASVGYTNQEGILRTSQMKRTTGTLNLNPSLFQDHLHINAGLKGMYIDNRFADNGVIGGALHFDPTQVVKSDALEFDKFGGYFTWLLNGERNINGTTNPVARLEQRNDKSYVNRVIGDLQFEYKLHGLPDLKFNLVTGIDYTDSNGKVVNADDASFTEADNSELKRDYTHELKNELVDFYINYNKAFASQHNLDAMLGYEWQHFWSKSESESTLRNVNDIAFSSDETENYLVSFFGRLNYSLNNKYLLTATIRRDGSSRFHEDTRWGTFPSVALAWKIKNEEFLHKSKTISSLTFRLGYGITGQQSLLDNDYPYLGTYTRSDEFSQYQFGSKYIYTLRPNGYDEKLKWEETTTYNAAFDYGLFNNRVYGSLDIYFKETKDLINTIPVPSGSNFTDLLTTNVGNLENKGVEFSLNSLVLSRKNLTWDLGFNITYNKNEITKLTNYEDPDYSGVETGSINGVGVGNYIQINAVGHPLNSYYTYEQIYDSEGKPVEGEYVDRNDDGVVDSKDKYYNGSPDPKVFLGLSSKFEYRNFDFSFNGRASFGNNIYNNTAVTANYKEMVVNDYLTNLPASIKETEFERPQQFSDHYIEDASFFRMDNMTLGYSFNLFPKAEGNTNVRVYSSVQNVFVITDYKGIDPEVTNGIDYNVFPRPRTFIFGIQVNF